MAEIDEGLDPSFGGTSRCVTEMGRELAGVALQFIRRSFDSIPISMCDVLKSEF